MGGRLIAERVRAGLQKLDLEACDDLDDAKLRSLIRLPNLSRLNVIECPLLTEGGLTFVIGHMQHRCKVFHGYW